MKKLVNIWKMSVGWYSMTKEQRKYAIAFGSGTSVSIGLASIHYFLGLVAFFVLALCLPKISCKLNIPE